MGDKCGSKIVGGGATRAKDEECEDSTESGWTMYICSDQDNDSCEDSASSASNGHRASKNIDRDDMSDDSMASDASSGPLWGSEEKAMELQQKQKHRDPRQTRGVASVKREGGKLGESASAVKLPKSAKHRPALSLPKVRKNIWIDTAAK